VTAVHVKRAHLLLVEVLGDTGQVGEDAALHDGGLP
jgi:hypothetical protein